MVENITFIPNTKCTQFEDIFFFKLNDGSTTTIIEDNRLQIIPKKVQLSRFKY